MTCLESAKSQTVSVVSCLERFGETVVAQRKAQYQAVSLSDGIFQLTESIIGVAAGAVFVNVIVGIAKCCRGCNNENGPHNVQKLKGKALRH
mmetsp:Transcript_5057/g.14138  ORF Transcript_5057/g.14138 Transcript_5057/m.14138 type:complete len:92 (+) Transcript_5057:216-491(+)